MTFIERILAELKERSIDDLVGDLYRILDRQFGDELLAQAEKLRSDPSRGVTISTVMPVKIPASCSTDVSDFERESVTATALVWSSQADDSISGVRHTDADAEDREAA